MKQLLPDLKCSLCQIVLSYEFCWLLLPSQSQRMLVIVCMCYTTAFVSPEDNFAFHQSCEQLHTCCTCRTL